MLRVDKDLFAAPQAGDRDALERLLSQLRPDILRYARFQCYASSSIEDVVQETLIVVYRRVGDVRRPAALGGWPVKVVARLCALPVLMFMRSIEELKTIENSVHFANLAVAGSTRHVIVALPAIMAALIAFGGCPMCWIFELVERGSQTRQPDASGSDHA